MAGKVELQHEEVRITVLKTTLDEELARQYGVPGLTACPMLRAGQVFYADYAKPEGLCDEAGRPFTSMCSPSRTARATACSTSATGSASPGWRLFLQRRPAPGDLQAGGHPGDLPDRLHSGALTPETARGPRMDRSIRGPVRFCPGGDRPVLGLDREREQASSAPAPLGCHLSRKRGSFPVAVLLSPFA